MREATRDDGETIQEQERRGERRRQQKRVGNDKTRQGDDEGEGQKQSDSGGVRNRPIYVYRGSKHARNQTEKSPSDRNNNTRSSMIV